MLEKCCKPQISTGISGVNSSLRALSILMSYSHFFSEFQVLGVRQEEEEIVCLCSMLCSCIRLSRNKVSMSCHRSFGCVFACKSPFTERRERVFSNQLCMINFAYDEIRSNRVCTTEGYAILLRSTSYLHQVLRTYRSKCLKSEVICQGMKYTSLVITTTLK